MAHIVIIGAGLGGMPMAYEMQEQLRKGDKVTVVGNGPNYHFVPSNPWVAVRWRKRSEIEFPVAGYLGKKGIAFNPAGAKRVHPEKNQVELGDGAVHQRASFSRGMSRRRAASHSCASSSV